MGDLGCSKKSTKNKSVNRSWDKRSESINVRPISPVIRLGVQNPGKKALKESGEYPP